MSVRLFCPYCNTAVAVETVPPSRRAVCPRCGENFPVRPPSAEDPDPHLPGVSANGPPEPSPPPSADDTVRSLQIPALIGLALGLVVLALGLYFIFGPHGRGTSPPTDSGPPKPSATLPPAAVPGLAYLPTDTNVAFAVQPGAVVQYADRTKADPRQLLTRTGVPEGVLATLDRAGVKLEQVDHLAGGVVVPTDGLFPRMILALALKAEPADRAAFQKALKAEAPRTGPDDRLRYSVDLGLGLPFTMTSPDPRTYLFATDSKDLDAAASAKGRGSGHLPAGLRESMGKLSPASVAWVATDAANWSDRPAVKLAAQVLRQPDLPERLATVRAVAAGVSLEPDPKLTAAVRAPGEAAGRKLQDSVAAALAARDPPVEIGGSGEWVTVESPIDPEKGVSGLTAVLPKPAGK